MSEKIEILNVGQPGKSYKVDKAKFEAMRTAVLGALPPSPPGMTPADLIQKVKPGLPADLFPGGEKAGWWVKAVQLDLEARGKIARAERPPVRLWRSEG